MFGRSKNKIDESAACLSVVLDDIEEEIDSLDKESYEDHENSPKNRHLGPVVGIIIIVLSAIMIGSIRKTNSK